MASQRRAWLALSLLAALCAVLAVLQYRWIGEISNAERQKLHEDLRQRVDAVRRGLNSLITESCAELQPSAGSVKTLGPQAAYSLRYLEWRQSHEPMYRRIGLAIPRGEELDLYDLNLKTTEFTPVTWPVEWMSLHQRLLQRLRGEPARFVPREPTVIEVPRFGPDRSGTSESSSENVPREREWLLAEVDPVYMRSKMLPDLLSRYLGADGKLDYEAEVVVAGNPSEVIYRSPGYVEGGSDDLAIRLLDVRFPARPPRLGEGPRGRPPRLRRIPPRPGSAVSFGPPSDRDGIALSRGVPPEAPGGPGLWLLRVRHHAGSLENLVAQVRRRNLAISGGVLLLMIATVAMLVHFSRRAQQLAELQINFVAGVSHELRTPLAVIGTAAYNLRGKLAQSAGQVEQYGKLIQQEAAKLGDLVERILHFAGIQAGHAVRKLEPIPVRTLVDRALESFRSLPEASGAIVEEHIQPDLPAVMVDQAAIGQVLRNLLDNALKHGRNDQPWIGISASSATGETGVEITIADRGPGIPAGEQKRIFDAFFRGRRALSEQIHGTGLGLNLVKRIVDGHGGSIRLESAPGKGTAFIIRLPVASPSGSQRVTNELTHSAG